MPCTTLTAFGAAASVNDGFAAPAGQLFTRFTAFTVPIPVEKSQPIVVPYAALNAAFEVESTPTDPSAK